MKNSKVILFAGPIGSSKSPIANYLSWNLGLPIFNRDIIRTEVREDIRVFDIEEFERRSLERLKRMLKMRRSFILDASIDRKGEEIFSQLEGYELFLISINLSKDFLKKIYKYKGYLYQDAEFDKNYNEHEKFVKEYAGKIDLSITDVVFKDRLEISLKEVEKWLNGV
ncbi:TPA: hypothetical protein DEP90_03440 [Patescibacteria group bacterium]|nr:hypothetical protein [Patescibacteria group bacterium]